MSGLDVEALLEEAEKKNAADAKKIAEKKERRPDSGSDRRGGSYRNRSPSHRVRSRERRDDRRYDPAEERRIRNGAKPDLMTSPRSGSDKDRDLLKREVDADSHRFRSRHDDPRDDPHRASRKRSRSPDDRYYRPRDGFASHRERSRSRSRDYHRDRDRDRRRRPERRRSRTPPPARRRRPSETEAQEPSTVNEEERDKRTIFVQQLAARLRERELKEFFTRAGPVQAANIVKDRISLRSKGVGYVEFRSEESVDAAIELTGQKLLGIPIIAQRSDAEKNRQAKNNAGANGNTNGVPYHRVFFGNIHFSVTEEDIKDVFSPYGEVETIHLQKDDQNRSRGHGYLQFIKPDDAKQAVQELNDFTIAGRAMRVGLGGDRFTKESTNNILQRWGQQTVTSSFQGSQFSGAGGRGAHAGGAGFDRAGGGRDDRGAGAASALDDTDVSGVNFSNYSRDTLMRKLAREEDNFNLKDKDKELRGTNQTTKNTETLKASRCVLVQNLFNAEEELKQTGANWAKEMEEEVRNECAERYGEVLHISVDPNSDGDCYLAFKELKGGDNALKGLNGRKFAGRMLAAEPVVEAVYKAQFPRANL